MKLYVILTVMLMTGCARMMGDINSTDQVERGLSYIAGAIVLHAILRILG